MLPIFNKDYLITETMTDVNGNMKMSSLFTLLHDAADEHLARHNCSKYELLQEGILWVIANQTATITRMPRENEKITIKTWVGKQRLTFFPRYYEVICANETIVSASAAWALMHSDTRQLYRPDPSRFAFAYTDSANGQNPFATVVSCDVTKQYCFTVNEGHLDMNDHMNNARYFDEFERFIPPAKEGRCPHSVIARYAIEALCGDEIKCAWGEYPRDKKMYDNSTDHKYFVTCSSEKGNHLKAFLEY